MVDHFTEEDQQTEASIVAKQNGDVRLYRKAFMLNISCIFLPHSESSCLTTLYAHFHGNEHSLLCARKMHSACYTWAVKIFQEISKICLIRKLFRIVVVFFSRKHVRGLVTKVLFWVKSLGCSLRSWVISVRKWQYWRSEEDSPWFYT